jgi:ABC-type phosphate transport system substrate-binding protein
MKYKTLIITIMMILLFSLVLHSKEISIIVNKSNKIITLKQFEVKKIFTGRKRSWENGNRIIVVIFKKGKAHTDFLKKFIKKNSTQFSILWKKLIFTGQAPLLKYVKTQSEMINQIKTQVNAIGYVFKDDLVKEVKDLYIR